MLAAGRASRFGRAKCLLPAEPGETLLSRVVGLAAGAVPGRIAVVVGHDAEHALAEVARVAAAGLEWSTRVGPVLNPRYAAGLSTSLVAGVTALPSSAGVLVLLADQPALDAGRLQQLVRRFMDGQPNLVASAAASQGEQRTPVVLAAALFPEVRALSGDQGARRVLAAHRGRVALDEWGDGLWFEDVDSPDDYQRLATAMGWRRQVTSDQ